MRECKKCKKTLTLTSFDKQYNKNTTKKYYTWVCSPCLRIKRKPYLKKHHKETYVKTMRPKKYKTMVNKTTEKFIIYIKNLYIEK